MESSLMQQEITDWIALSLVPGIGARTVRTLLEQWREPRAIFQAGGAELARCGLREEAIQSLQSHQTRNQAMNQCEQLKKLGGVALTLNDPAYPGLLKEIYDPPPVLYTRGDLASAFAQPAIAIVGSRRCTAYGRQIAELLARELATRGITIVSGLARGIDTAAHRAALDAGGKTVAVLGNGLDIVYPSENRALAGEIIAQGALASELPFGTPPLPQNFPFRNRIIAGLCLGVIIVEAAERSGSLITARLATEQNREVFAVPGNITSANSFGPNYLIKDGAKLVQSWRDVVEELPAEIKTRIIPELVDAGSGSGQQELFPLDQLSQSERSVYDLIRADAPRHIDELMLASKLGVGEFASALLALELKDKIKQLPGKNFIKRA
jgi:DNA processing protein